MGKFTKRSGKMKKRLEDAAKKPRRKRRKARRFARNPGTQLSPRSNPPLLSDLAEYAIPGFGGFVITKFIANLASSQIAKRWPQYARHAGAISSIGTFLSAWWLGHRVQMLARWHSPIVVGSAIASAHNLVQLYFPDKLAWVVGSPKHAAISSAVASQQQQQAMAAAAAAHANGPDLALPDHLEEVNDDPSWYTFNDAYDGGRMKTTPAAVAAVTAQVENQPLPQDADDDELASGLFANNSFTASMEN